MSTRLMSVLVLGLILTFSAIASAHADDDCGDTQFGFNSNVRLYNYDEAQRDQEAKKLQALKTELNQNPNQPRIQAAIQREKNKILDIDDKLDDLMGILVEGSPCTGAPTVGDARQADQQGKETEEPITSDASAGTGSTAESVQ